MLITMGHFLTRSLFLCIVSWAVCPQLWAQKPSVVTLVPAAAWHLTNSEKLDVGTVTQWRGDPSVDREYGVKALDHRSYRLENKTADVVVEESPDSSTAYGLFTYYRTESMQPVRGFESAATEPSETVMARGRFFTRILPQGGASISASDLRALLTSLEGQQPAGPDSVMSLPTPLPAAGIVSGSEKYILGPIGARNVAPTFPPELIGFSQGAEMEVASYQTKPAGSPAKSATLIAITYPTSQIAREQFAMDQKQLPMNEGDASVFGERKGSYVFLTFNADAKTAASILGQFDVSARVSWDQKYPGKKSVVLQMLEIIISNAILVLVLVGFSVVGGITIVLAKRLARKWFPEMGNENADGEGLVVLNLR